MNNEGAVFMYLKEKIELLKNEAQVRASNFIGSEI